MKKSLLIHPFMLFLASSLEFRLNGNDAVIIPRVFPISSLFSIAYALRQSIHPEWAWVGSDQTAKRNFIIQLNLLHPLLYVDPLFRDSIVIQTVA